MLTPDVIPELRRLQSLYAELALENANLFVVCETIVNSTTSLKRRLDAFREQREANAREIDLQIDAITSQIRDDPGEEWKSR